MPRYIDKQKLIDALIQKQRLIPIINGIRGAIEVIKNNPDADVAPVKHGKWILDREKHSMCEDEYICSKCKVSVCSEGWCNEKFLEMYKHCPNCGAKMDLE